VNEHIKEIAIDFSELALDSLTDDGILKDLPVIGTLVRIAKATRSMSDFIFANKIKRFIEASEQMPFEKKEQFRAILDAKPELRQKAGEVVVMALNSADDLKKAGIIGKLFSHFILNEIDFETLRRLLVAVNRAFIDDLLNFPRWAMQQNAPDTFDPATLDGTGLVSGVIPIAKASEGYRNLSPIYGHTDLGTKYAKLFLGYHPAEL
jgi:hypothetical protein